MASPQIIRIAHSFWVELRQFQYWMHRRIHATLLMRREHYRLCNFSRDAAIDAGYCLDSQVELLV